MCIFVLLQKKSVTHLHFVLFFNWGRPQPRLNRDGSIVTLCS
jgi:hypothetical protein